MVSMDVGEVAVGSGGTGPGPNPLPTGLRADLERMEFEVGLRTIGIPSPLLDDKVRPT